MSVDTSVNISSDTSIQYPTKNSREYLPHDVYNWGGRGKGDISGSLLPKLISYRAGAWHYRNFPDFLKSPVSKWRIVRVKTRTKASFFEGILINIPSKNLPKLSKERMQYFCHALKLNLRNRHSAARASIVR